MNLRARLIFSVILITALTFAGGLGVIFRGANRLEERQLDRALYAAAELETRDGHPLVISDRPGPSVGRLGPLTKYGAIFRDDGTLVFATPAFGGETPTLPASMEELEETSAFNFWFRREYLRAVIVRQPDLPDTHLVIAVPRSYLDGDDGALLRAMGIVYVIAVAWTGLVTAWVVTRLTRDHEAIATVARNVAGGDLSARIGQRSGDPQSAQLARDVDEMIARLGQLVDSQKRFIAYAAHELRSPLTMLYGELAHARSKPRDAESYRATIEEAFEASEHLKALTDDLLALARLNVGPERAQGLARLDDLVQTVQRATYRLARDKGVTVRWIVPEVTVTGSAPDLARLVRNLVENAIRHAPTGTDVDVQVTPFADRLELEIRDDGPGVPAGEEEKIFEPFYRLASAGDEAAGSGLGLAIAREIARAHDGDVTVRRSEGRGAVFLVTLPVTAAR